MAPGGLLEGSNVAAWCPAGTSASVVTVATDRTASYDRAGRNPDVVAWGYYPGGNSTAEDLLDHWCALTKLRSALVLSAIRRSAMAERKSRLGVLLESAGGERHNAEERFRNVRVEDIQIIGQKIGIIHGQWNGDPAGTPDIEFDLRFAPDHDTAAIRAGMGREGNLWSCRLHDNFDSHVIERGKGRQSTRAHSTKPAMSAHQPDRIPAKPSLLSPVNVPSGPVAAGPHRECRA